MAAPLSPRSANLPLKPESKGRKDQLEVKAAALRTVQREKDHPPPPPSIVKEPVNVNGEPGEVYRVGRYLGRGGFAICYEGETKTDERNLPPRKYALKIVKSAMPNVKLVEKFKTELQIHSKMHHPNIVEFHRAFAFGESTFVVLELCNNGSLMEMVKQRKFLSEPEVRRFVIQMCGAMKYLHGKNVIHRDLKMGNIFLDDNMNVKIGDFGLAALLLSQSEYSLNRRRTLCGTPNYIAPEVLAKSWKGHDHKVDIWSLGIIIYAMLTGFPPFQSKTQEEIYRKVKARSYIWPSEEACPNHISQHAKDLVAALLVDANERPESDEIVGHEFFTKGLIANTLTPAAKKATPAFEDWTAQTGFSETVWRRRQWANACRQCGVGKVDGIHSFPAVGKEPAQSTYKECLLEEKAGRRPIVPIPPDVVYRRFILAEALVRPTPVQRKQAVPGSFPESPVSQEVAARDKDAAGNLKENQGPVVTGHIQVQPAPRRQESKSHAAQLRERDQPAKRRPRDVPKAGLNWDYIGKGLTFRAEGLTQPSLATITGKPVRLNGKTVSTKDLPTDRPAIARITRSQSAQEQLTKVLAENPEQPPIPPVRGSSLKNQKSEVSSGSASRTERERERERELKSNVVYDVRRKKVTFSPVEEGVEVEEEKSCPSRSAARKPASLSVAKLQSQPSQTAAAGPRLISPDEEGTAFIPHTSWHDVHVRLSIMLDNIRTALNRRQASRRTARRRNTVLPLVIKWVDYSNKFGIGYTLNDGSMGCLFNADSGGSSSGVFVPGGVTVTRNGDVAKRKKQRQLGMATPLEGSAVQFYARSSDQGFKRLLVEEDQCMVYLLNEERADSKGSMKSTRGLPEYSSFDAKKRRALLLWSKFASYMRDSLARTGSEMEPAEDEDADADEAAAKTDPSKATIPCVLFYQRLGNVGIWGFDDGSFQFNFPDHTKLIFSAEATHLDFYHLPEEVASQLYSPATPRPSPSAILTREVLGRRGIISYPLRDIVCRDLSSVARANQLEHKLRFVVDVLRQWLSFGGLGRLNPAMFAGTTDQAHKKVERIRWMGVNGAGTGEEEGDQTSGDDGGKKKAASQKMVWVSIGAVGGDIRVL